MATALNAQISCTKVSITIVLLTSSLFVADNHDPLDSTGFLTTHISSTTATAGITAEITAGPATTTTSNTVHAAAATTAITGTVTLVFDFRNLPADVLKRCNDFMYLTPIMTQNNITPLAMPTGRVAIVHL